MKRWPLLALALAALLVAGSAWHFGRGLADYDHARHPLALLGAAGAPDWRLANALLFVLPGALVMGVAWTLRARLPAAAPWPLRMALQLGLLAALGYALQGLCNLDPSRLPDDGSNRWHAAAWLLWWLTFAASALLLACSRGLPTSLRVASLAIAVLLPPAMLGLLPRPSAALVHRIGIGLWLGWWFALALALSRGEASSPGSSSTARR